MVRIGEISENSLEQETLMGACSPFKGAECKSDKTGVSYEESSRGFNSSEKTWGKKGAP